MAMSLQKGFRGKLDEHLNSSGEISVEMAVTGSSVYDFSCFGVDDKNKLTDDRYMVFYNQKSSPNGEIALVQSPTGANYRIKLASLPATINKLVFTIAIDGNGTMNAVSRCSIKIAQGGMDKLTFDLSGKDFQNEKAVIMIEIYRKDGWRIAAVGSGFNGGLGDLLKSYGGEEVAKVSPPPPKPTVAPTPTVSLLEKRLEKEAPALVSLAKPLKISLEKHKLAATVAKVALVMDISGSMSAQYQQGIVQEIVNRTVPLAVQFDDDGDLDFWYYGAQPKRMDAVTLKNYQKAVPRDWNALMWSLGIFNSEPAVMKEVIAEYAKSTLPAYVLFITDGGVGAAHEIQRLMIESSKLPIFWQFIGVGGSDYGILEKLDTMSGRFIDNANFFALDDFRRISNDVLYDRLLTEFPLWLKEAKAKGILR